MILMTMMMTTASSEGGGGGARLMRQLVDAIKHLNPIQHAEIFKMLNQSGAMFTQNSNGVFCDLTAVDEQVVQDIGRFVTFWSSNKQELDEYDKRLCEAKMQSRGGGAQQVQPPSSASSATGAQDQHHHPRRVQATSVSTFQQQQQQQQQQHAAVLLQGKKKCTTTRFMLAKKRFSKRSALGRAVADTVLEEELFPE